MNLSILASIGSLAVDRGNVFCTFHARSSVLVAPRCGHFLHLLAIVPYAASLCLLESASILY